MLSSYSKYAALFIAVLFSQISFAEGDPQRGRLLADTCKGCHAVASYNNVYPTYHVPRIAGQSEKYLADALRQYRQGDRGHETMVAQAASLSDQDIDDIAAYISAAGPQVENDAIVGQAPGKASTCAACHGPAGRSAIPDNPTLAGQYLDYLRQTLEQYRQGTRKGPNAAVMQAQLMTIGEDELAAVAAFYARQSGLSTLAAD